MKMDTYNLENKRIAFFHGNLTSPGGSERVTVEEVKYFERKGARTYILTDSFKKEGLFNETYKADIQLVGKSSSSNSLPIRVMNFVRTTLALRKKIREINPSIIISRSSFECVYLYFATLFTPFSYVTHIHETISWWAWGLRSWSLIYRKAFNEIRKSTTGHHEFIPEKRPKANPIRRILTEFAGIAEYIAVRKARKIFVLSNPIKWEVNKLYGKEAVVVRGGFPAEILSYKPKQDIKEKLGLPNKKVILNVNRLIPTKRVDLLIEAFKQISDNFEDAVLVIGGTGPEEQKLKNLAFQLGIEAKVKFVGFIKEEELWDYYAGCDVFAHPDWLTSAIAPYEALALQKKVVWSSDMEVDQPLRENRHIFVASPTVDDLAEVMGKALTTEITEKNDLSNYTWDRYCERIMMELIPVLSG